MRPALLQRQLQQVEILQVARIDRHFTVVGHEIERHIPQRHIVVYRVEWIAPGSARRFQFVLAIHTADQLPGVVHLRGIDKCMVF